MIILTGWPLIPLCVFIQFAHACMSDLVWACDDAVGPL
jgi:hypothetical protein